MMELVASFLPRTSPGSIQTQPVTGRGQGWPRMLLAAMAVLRLPSPERRKPLWRLCESLLVSFLAGDSGVEMAWGFLFLFCFLWNPALDKYTWTVGLWGLRHHVL